MSEAEVYGQIAFAVTFLSLYSPSAIAIAVFTYHRDKTVYFRLLRSALWFIYSLLAILLGWEVLGHSFEIWIIVITVTSTLIAIGNIYYALKRKFAT